MSSPNKGCADLQAHLVVRKRKLKDIRQLAKIIWEVLVYFNVVMNVNKNYLQSKQNWKSTKFETQQPRLFCLNRSTLV